MCKQRVALEMLISQTDKGGLSEGAILLHQKQCEDTEAMQLKMSELEKKVDGLDKKVDGLDKKFDLLLDKLEKGDSFLNVIKSFAENKVVQAIIVSILATYVGGSYLPQLLDFLK